MSASVVHVSPLACGGESLPTGCYLHAADSPQNRCCVSFPRLAKPRHHRRWIYASDPGTA